ncbi:cobalt transporter [Pseudomonas lactis]|nr:CbtB domain-containing protein [Pseudomonas lactis]MCF5036416.1 cobalt transporter [Pseudomonas lactis]
MFKKSRPIISSTSHTATSTATLSQRLTAAIGASILGACLVYFAGFSHIEAVHNAAHDTRHSAAFPCH